MPEYSLEKESNAEAVEGPRVDMVWKESVSPAVSSKTPKWAESEQVTLSHFHTNLHQRLL